ncbi:MAG: DNA repair protein RecO [Ruminococcus sp.]|nr:DNA repair protein RecO [Candidatus Copronaster equi]
MKLMTDGLIIREQQTGEDDRLVTLLTRDYGVIRAFVRGAKRIRSKAQSSTQLFAYGNYSIYRGRDAYSIDEAQPIEIFFDLRNDIEALALAQYFCELANELAPVEEQAEDYLRLVLNTLHMLSKNKRPMPQLKAIVELRMMCLSGYMPDLVICGDCQEDFESEMFFSPVEGKIFCKNCVKNHTCLSLPNGVLSAMRHICYSDDSKLFSFTLQEENMQYLSEITEQFLLSQTRKKYKTLDFYKTVKL